MIKIKAVVDHKRFYNEESSWGVYGFTPIEKRNDIITDKFNTFVVSGNTFELIEGKEYDLEIESTFHPKYGKGYGFVSVKQEKPTTASSQQEYIRALLPESQANAIIQKYPNEKILDMMKEDTFDYTDIHGIGEKRYKKIRSYLLANLDMQDAITELKDLNINFKAMKKLVDHFGSPELVVQKVKDNIYSLCEVKMFGFKKVDGYAMNRGDAKDNPNRIQAAIIFILKSEEQEGHTWMTKFDLVEKMKELLEIERSIIEVHIQALDKRYFYQDENRVANRYTFDTEKEIKLRLERILKVESKLNIEEINNKIKEIESEQGFSFSEEQMEAIKLSLKYNVLIIDGKAGTGKSTVLKGIIKIHNQYNHVACALSGKASNILVKNGLNGMTLHRTLGTDGVKFKYNEENKLPYHITALDESGMVNIYLFNSLVKAIKEGYKLFILGDIGQLASIGAGAVFRDLIDSGKIPRIELTQVQRQAKKSGILSKANEIREGNQILQSDEFGKHVFGELEDFYVYGLKNKGGILPLVIDIAKKLKGKSIDDFQVITGRKKGGDISVTQLNKTLQGIFNDTSQKGVKKGEYTYYINDKIIQCGNNYEAGEDGEISVFNGTIGKIIDIQETYIKGNKKHEVYIQFEGIDRVIKYTEEELDQIELAYAISVHRSQGSTIKNVLFVFDYSSYKLLSRQFVYTGPTRASKWCMMICELSALRYAINTDVSHERRTFLGEMFQNK
ncbi:ATP-dependent RecD-like DNA helicase [Halalkalibacter oceani]|uniref:ATP-dependent RecD-like DNA helicase n=1 Tax=Halalkalibacter oceani TaxID=1653776 RepID=UPI00339AFBE0